MYMAVDIVAPFLEPEEKVEHTFLVHAGVHPVRAGGLGALGMVLTGLRMVAVTDRAIVLLAANHNGTRATRLLARLPRDPGNGVSTALRLAGRKAWIRKRFQALVETTGLTASP
jgi:hypothetical protein